MLFKNVAISEKSRTHTFFIIGFAMMVVGLFVNVLYVSGLFMKELGTGYVTSFVVAFVCTYAFYRCALSPNGYLNTYLKFWWYFFNGGEKQKLKWYDKMIFMISVVFSVVGAFSLFCLGILALGLTTAVIG